MIAYPPELPITAKRAAIVQAVRKHPVVIISGETGCGKSTQLPKMCFEAGCGRRGRIGCTQPRRIAATSIAARIAEEIGEPVGRTVGYKIRFEEKTSRDTRIKILTDGMLLAETQSDPRLAEYDTLIIDEAHERSLNIDFLLGIVKTLLPVRPDLKLVITSATLDIEKFQAAFDGAPVLEVSGRLYPVEVEYRPPVSEREDDDTDYVDLAAAVVDDLRKERPPGDILIFMPTEQDILETCEILVGRKYSGVAVLPLYARLPGSEQGRVYSVTGPKIVVATNVAETSLTIPGITYVIDTGLARISQYLPGVGIQSLPIRPISKSSADQRMGRCGRVRKGLCLRLYAEEDYADRPQFTLPEILRSNLAEVILRMVDLRLGDPLKFPFVDRPQVKAVEDAYETLAELGALARRGPDAALTETGRLMARMPLDPRISRMLLEARREGCLRETAVIASALSIRDPRERPQEKAAQADAVHAPFRHPDSDFLTLLNIWDRYHGDFEDLGSPSKKRKFCHDHFLSFSRMREWMLIHREILEILRELKLPAGRTHRIKGQAFGSPRARGFYSRASPAELDPRAKPGAPTAVEISKDLYAAVHRSILSGYLAHIAAHKDKNTYAAAKGREAMVFPGSTLFNKNASWIVAAELVRTSRLFARTAARIFREWLEDLGGDLCRRTYIHPRWDKAHGQVVADESVSLFGLEIVSDRTVAYGPVDPEGAHRIFIRAALVAGQVKEPFVFLKHNLALQRRLVTMEEKLRRRDILVDDKVLAEFYALRIPGVFDIRGLKDLIRSRGNDAFLEMTESDILKSFPSPEALALYPDELPVGGRMYRAVYKFSPGEEDDGVTLTVPADQVSRIPAEPLEWGVPGFFKDKVEEVIKGLPKRYRKLLVPAADTAGIIAREIVPSGTSLFEVLAKFVKMRFRADIPAAEWARVELPRHLKMRVALVDPHGKELVAGRDLEVLRRARREASLIAAQDPEIWARARRQWERTGLTAWDFGSLPEMIAIGPGAVAYPGLEEGEAGVALRLFPTHGEAQASHVRGVQALLLQRFAKDLKFMERRLSVPQDFQKAALYFGGSTAVEKMLEENLKAEIFRKNLRSSEDFKAYAETLVRALFEKAHALWEATHSILEAYQRLRADLVLIKNANPSNKILAGICDQIRADVERLIPRNFLEIYALDKLVPLARYVESCRRRAERAKNGPDKDRKKAEQAAPFVKALERMRAAVSPTTPAEIAAAVEEFGWMVEEFKVSLFAPELKTAFPISPKRLAEKMKEIEAWNAVDILSKKQTKRD